MVAMPRPIAASLEMLYALQKRCDETYAGRQIVVFVYCPVDANTQFFCATAIDGVQSRVIEVWHGNVHANISAYLSNELLDDIEECADEMITGN
jgi:hypothetical protein